VSNECTSALVTIGMPVYNGEASIRPALDALLGQSYRGFILLISDNASTDATETICRGYAARDSRIRYIRQPKNLGAEANFKFVFLEAQTEFFMWAAVDDLRSADFLEDNLAFLQAHPDYVGSISPVRCRGGDFDPVEMGDAALAEEDRYDRLAQFFSGWHANGRFYSLFRRKAIVGWQNLDNPFLGSDWTLVTHLALQGKLNRLATGWVELGTHGISRRTDIFARYRRRPADWVLPFNRLAIDTLKKLSGAAAGQWLSVLKSLLLLNLQAFGLQFYVMLQRRARH
jgi:glycosyltransferase involved in cell wall biosynthesis